MVHTAPSSRSCPLLPQVDQGDVSRRSSGYAGTLCSNFLGTEFMCYDHSEGAGAGGRLEQGAVEWWRGLPHMGEFGWLLVSYAEEREGSPSCRVYAVPRPLLTGATCSLTVCRQRRQGAQRAGGGDLPGPLALAAYTCTVPGACLPPR